MKWREHKYFLAQYRSLGGATEETEKRVIRGEGGLPSPRGGNTHNNHKVRTWTSRVKGVPALRNKKGVNACQYSTYKRKKNTTNMTPRKKYSLNRGVLALHTQKAAEKGGVLTPLMSLSRGTVAREGPEDNSARSMGVCSEVIL